MNKIVVNKAIKRNILSFLILYGILSFTGTIQAAASAGQSGSPEAYDYTKANHADQVSPIEEEAYLDIEEMPQELTSIIEARTDDDNDPQLLAVVAEDTQNNEYYKYLFASNGLLANSQSQQKAHNLNYHLVKADAGPVIWQVLSFLDQKSGLEIQALVLPKDTQLCLPCSHMCVHLFDKKQPVHKTGCQGQLFPTTAAPASAIACFYSDRFTDQQRRLVISQVGDQAFPDPKKVVAKPAQKPHVPISNKPVTVQNQLHMAVQLNFPVDTIKVLLTNLGVSINALDSTGKTALDYAPQGNNDVYNLLVGHNAKTSKQLTQARTTSSKVQYKNLPKEQLLIPANGQCLYTTIIMGYLLSVRENADEATVRINKLFGMQPADYINELYQTLENPTHYLTYLHSDAFSNLVTAFMARMQIKKGTWGGAQEIQSIATKLKVNIQEHYPDPSNPTTLLASDLTKPAEAESDITIHIVRDKVHPAEVNTEEDKASAEDNKQYQHYRLKYTLPASIVPVLPSTQAPSSHQTASSPTNSMSILLEEWFEAARVGNEIILTNLHNEHKIEVDAVDGDMYTALMKSAEKGKLDCVKYLISEGANINATNEWGNTALIWSARKGHIEVVKHLVQKGADVNAKNGIGNTALLLSAQEGHVDCVKFLLEKGANVDANNKSGYTALLLSARFGRLDCVKLLVQKGAKTTLKGQQHKTALEWAKEEGKNDVVNYLSNLNNQAKNNDNNAEEKKEEE